MEYLADVGKMLIPGVFIAVLSAAVTVKMALRRFHEEKWWERKEASYASLLEVLHRFKNYASKHHHRQVDPEDTSNEEMKSLEAEWRATTREYERLRDLASFHLSDEAVKILCSFDERKRQARDESDIAAWIEEDLAAAAECLEHLKSAAKRDLKVK